MEVPAACLNLPATRLSPRRHGDRVNGPAMSPSGQARRFELPTVTSGALPYVERPLRQVLFRTMAQRERCGHMSGLLARSKTAGLDEVRDASG